MLARPRAIPLAGDASSRFLPWIVGVMVYLAALALAGAMALGAVADRWDRELSGTLTVQIPPVLAAEAGGEEAAAGDEARLEAALALVRGTPGVAAAEALDRAETVSLLEPWLGAGLAGEDLPLPRMIDVMLEPGAEVEAKSLEAALAAAVPGASVDDHGVWFDRLARLARWVGLVAAGVVALIGLAAVLTVIFVTRSGLSVHHGIIELLHLIGAEDAYIARQFQAHALRLGLKGGVPGVALAALTLLALGRIASPIEAPLLPHLGLSPEGWAALAGVPAVAAVIAMLTARVTVLRTLGKMP